jgi:transcriptional regulator with XRE-family HTH domain
MSKQISWAEGHRLIEKVGGEDHLALRITTERNRLGLSQEKLAEAMAKAGCPVPQSAISKIENPARGGRRAITVEEAIAFSKVFSVPLGELLLPAAALDYVQALKALADGPDLLIAADQARWEVEHAQEVLSKVARENTAVLSALVKMQDTAEEAAKENPEDSYRVRFLRGVSRPDTAPKAGGLK